METNPNTATAFHLDGLLLQIPAVQPLSLTSAGSTKHLLSWRRAMCPQTGQLPRLRSAPQWYSSPFS